MPCPPDLNTPIVTQKTDELQRLLLDLISPARPVEQARVDALEPSDWSVLLTMLHQHRLEPLLYWQLEQARAGLRVPAEVRNRLVRRYRTFALRSLALQRELVRVHRVLERAGIAHVALKGAYLAFHAYPAPALRPLRDLDVLVPSELVFTAYQALLDAGLMRMEIAQGTPEAYAVVAKHLPPLCTPGSQVTVELHAYLVDPTGQGASPGDPSRDAAFWQRGAVRRLADDELLYESPADLLLHLIVHAVHDHAFDNGPLLLSDLAFLTRTHAIDWPLFWQLANKGGWTRACRLALSLAQRYWGRLPIDWPAGVQGPLADDDPLLDIAGLLMLRDTALRQASHIDGQLAQAPGLPARVGLLLRKVFPSRTEMSVMFPVAAEAPAVYLWYPIRWWRLMTRTLPSQWRARRAARFHDEAVQLKTIRGWLTDA